LYSRANSFALEAVGCELAPANLSRENSQAADSDRFSGGAIVPAATLFVHAPGILIPQPYFLQPDCAAGLRLAGRIGLERRAAYNELSFNFWK
jgi:hypothetical protein